MTDAGGGVLHLIAEVAHVAGTEGDGGWGLGGTACGEEFVPRLFGELGVPIRSVSVSRPTLDDVFMSYTGSTIRDAEESADRQRSRMMMQVMTRGRR